SIADGRQRILGVLKRLAFPLKIAREQLYKRAAVLAAGFSEHEQRGFDAPYGFPGLLEARDQILNGGLEGRRYSRGGHHAPSFTLSWLRYSSDSCRPSASASIALVSIR